MSPAPAVTARHYLPPHWLVFAVYSQTSPVLCFQRLGRFGGKAEPDVPLSLSRGCMAGGGGVPLLLDAVRLAVLS